MNAVESVSTTPQDHLPSTWQKIEQRLEQLGDRLNPILVKEARQALKSRQFAITFSLMLSAAWGWSVMGIVSQLPDIYYAPAGLNLLIGYYFILAVPMLLVVPFSAFRSLASEREDATYELLSISTLTSRQIITGKLGSAILQMLVYYSALAPCITFTYLLRGVDIISVLLLLAYTFCLSILLCCIGLVFAGLATSRQWQSLISVVLLLALIGIGIVWATMIGGIAFAGIEQLPLDDFDFWIVQLALLTAFGTYTAILILTASAQNSFASDNRSTRIRVAMFAQTVLFIGWVAYGWARIGDTEFMLVMLFLAMIHWYVYGVLLSGESGRLSPRVRRQLPESFFGRAFLTWFNPGSGTGYVFAVSHVLVIATLAFLAAWVQRDFGVPNIRFRGIPEIERFMTCVALLAAYYTLYVGLARIIVVWIPRRDRYGLPLPVLVNLLILLLTCAAPFVYETWRNRYLRADYTVLQWTNWLWTLHESLDNGLGHPLVILIVLTLAVTVLVINLRMIRGEIESVRLAVPDRVKLDDGVQNGQDTDQVTAQADVFMK